MDPVQALAILSLGAFLTVLVTAVFYVFTVRPRLLEPVSLASLGLLDEELRQDLAEQRSVVEGLNAALAHHAEQLAAAAHTTSEEAFAGVQGMLRSQTDAVQALTGLLNAQTDRLAQLDERLNRQDEKLDRIEGRLDGHAGAPVPTPDYERLFSPIQAQADKLVSIGARLDEWVATSARGNDKLAEHARILAELDRELAAQAQVVQRLDAKVGEHTTMLVTAASERREQAGLLERTLQQIAQIVPLLNKLVAAPPRPGQDRLTDIKGIGPVYAGKLYEAGIQTYRQLAAMTPEEVYTLISQPQWRMRSIDAESWIEQAKHLASQREKVENLT
jgi:predicted flap endonuclease-1-like 5' DNA nuclease